MYSIVLYKMKFYILYSNDSIINVTQNSQKIGSHFKENTHL